MDSLNQSVLSTPTAMVGVPPAEDSALLPTGHGVDFPVAPTSSSTAGAAVLPDQNQKTLRYDPSVGSTKSNSDPHLSNVYETIEAVEQNHTAPKTKHGLNADYTLQAFLTGAPLLLVDIAVTAFTLLGIGYLVNLIQGHAVGYGLWLQLPVWIMLQAGMMWMHQLYPGAGVSAVSEMRGIVRSTFIACVALSAINLIFGQLPRIEFGIFVITAMGVSVALPVMRRMTRTVLSRSSWWGIRTLLIGSRAECQRWCVLMQPRRESGLNVVGYVCNEPKGPFLERSVTARKCCNQLGESHQAHEIASHYHAPVAALASEGAKGLAHRLIFQFPSLMWLDPSAAMMETANPIGTFSRRLNVPFLRLTPRLMKRCLDLLVCVPLLALLLIPFAVLAIAIKVLSPGPVLYGSPRVGQNGRRFKMWKFRSMVPNAGEVLRQHLANDSLAKLEWDRDQKLKNDPRVIRVIGRVMRSCSLDELPQLWNVLVGEMSLVGPRPLPPDEIVKYQTHYYQYSQMWPGITGLWQVSGRNDTSFETRVFLVHHYAANWSLWLDAWILLKTPMTVITRKGAY